MNKIYRLILNYSSQVWVAALACIFFMHAPLVQASDSATLPSGGQVVAGQASISQSGNAMTINQGSNKAILNWNSFGIGSQASVNFQQPSSQSVILNRVLGSAPSSIYGSLTANGQVFLINPNGVLFGQGARVNVGGMVASTLSIRNDDFLAGINRFTRNNAVGGITNMGALYGQYIALLSPEVRNEGLIAAHQGTVALAAGDAVTLGITGNKLISIQVDKATMDTLIDNKHLIQANAGTVILSAKSAYQLMGKVVNSGIVEAKGISNDGGIIRLLASSNIEHSGSINANGGANGKGGNVTLLSDLANSASRTDVSGSISAKGGSQSGDGGFIETSGSHLGIADTASVDSSAVNGKNGQWLLDPVDFTIATSGGDTTGTALATTLGGGTNVTIQSTSGASGTGGDVFVNDSVSWNAPSTLTLNAQRNIEINAPITVQSGGGTLSLQYAQSATSASSPFGNYVVSAPVNLAAGSTFNTKYGSDGVVTPYTVITDNAGLVAINSGMAGKYVLGANFAATTNPWAPLGNASGDVNTLTNFTGILDGLGHSVSGLTRTNTANSTGVGLFGSIGAAGTVQNLGLTSVNLAGLGSVGALAGLNDGAVSNVYATGTITGSDTATNVNAVGSIGGLIGSSSGVITNSYTNVTVNATTGTQTFGQGADGGIGGLVGYVSGGNITSSYARGSVTGIYDVGGLVGYSIGGIAGSYATGNVTGTTHAGGLLGDAMVVPFAPPMVSSSFWDTTTTTQASAIGNPASVGVLDIDVTGLATAAAQTQANLAGFDFTNTWIMYDGISYPLLRSMLTPFIVTAAAKSKTYDTNSFTGGGGTFTVSNSITPTPSTISTAGLAFGGTAATATNVGSYTITPSGVVLANNAAKQDQHGNYVRFADGSLSITPANLSVAGVSAANKIYDTLTTAILSGTATVTPLGGDTVTLGGTGVGTFADKNVGNGKVVNVTGFSLSGAQAGNYNIVQPAGVSANITKANVAVSGATAANKVYDGTTAATVTGTASVTPLGADNISISAGAVTGAFANKDVGTAKAVTLTPSGWTLGGSDAGNYTLTQAPFVVNADITPASVAVTGVTAADKVYDATTTATLGGTAVVTALGADTITVGGTGVGAFADKNVGNAKTVAVSGFTLGGAQAGNYSIVQPVGLSANITKASLTVTADNQSRFFGAANPTFTETLSGFVNGETSAVVTGTPRGSSTANATTTAGTVTITASAAGLSAINYNFANLVDGTLTISGSSNTSQSTTSGGFLLKTVKDETAKKTNRQSNSDLKKKDNSKQIDVSMYTTPAATRNQTPTDAKDVADKAAGKKRAEAKDIAEKVKVQKRAGAESTELKPKDRTGEINKIEAAMKTVIKAVAVGMGHMFGGEMSEEQKKAVSDEVVKPAQAFLKTVDKATQEKVIKLIEDKEKAAKAVADKKAADKTAVDAKIAVTAAKKKAAESKAAADKAAAEAAADPSSLEKKIAVLNSLRQANKDKSLVDDALVAEATAKKKAEDKAAVAEAVQSKAKLTQLETTAFFSEKEKIAAPKKTADAEAAAQAAQSKVKMMQAEAAVVLSEKKKTEAAMKVADETLKAAEKAVEQSKLDAKAAKTKADKTVAIKEEAAKRAVASKKTAADTQVASKKAAATAKAAAADAAATAKAVADYAKAKAKRVGIIAQLRTVREALHDAVSQEEFLYVGGANQYKKDMVSTLSSTLQNASSDSTDLATLKKLLDKVKANASKLMENNNSIFRGNQGQRGGYVSVLNILKKTLQSDVLSKVGSDAAAKEAKRSDKKASLLAAAAKAAAEKAGADSTEAVRLAALARAAAKTAAADSAEAKEAAKKAAEAKTAAKKAAEAEAAAEAATLAAAAAAKTAEEDAAAAKTAAAKAAEDVAAAKTAAAKTAEDAAAAKTAAKDAAADALVTKKAVANAVVAKKADDKRRKANALVNAKLEAAFYAKGAEKAASDAAAAKATADEAKATAAKYEAAKTKWERTAAEKAAQIPLTAKIAKTDAAAAKAAMDKFNAAKKAAEKAGPEADAANQAQLNAQRALQVAQRDRKSLDVTLKAGNSLEIISTIISLSTKDQGKIDAADAKVAAAQAKYNNLRKLAQDKINKSNALGVEAETEAKAANAAAAKAAKSDTAARQAKADKEVADKNVVIFTKNVKITADNAKAAAQYANYQVGRAMGAKTAAATKAADLARLNQ